MPRKNIRSKRRVSAVNLNRLNTAQSFYLRTGIVLSGLEEQLGFKCTDMLIIKALWRTHRGAIMERYRSDPHQAGKRPWAWWQFENPREDYKQLQHTYEEIETALEHRQLIDKKLQYLKDNNLLEPWEVEALKAREEGQFKNIK
jgi:hypothetical protein